MQYFTIFVAHNLILQGNAENAKIAVSIFEDLHSHMAGSLKPVKLRSLHRSPFVQNTSQSRSLHRSPSFQNGLQAKSGVEMCFGSSTLGAGAKTRLESRLKKCTPHCICRPDAAISCTRSIIAYSEPHTVERSPFFSKWCQTSRFEMCFLRAPIP